MTVMSTAATMKYTKELRNSLSLGRARRHMARIKLIEMALKPFPKKIAPMYFGGKRPPRFKVLPCITPIAKPRNTKRTITLHRDGAPSGMYYEVMGSASIMQARKACITLNLTVKENRDP